MAFAAAPRVVTTRCDRCSPPTPASALAAGSQFAAAAFIDRAVAEAARTIRGRPVLFLTGGAAPMLKRHLESPARMVPDLVLRGLAVFASAT